ncbi:MAG: hypothetical protein D6707_11135, partial [Bacteroidetes bacterium]
MKVKSTIIVLVLLLCNLIVFADEGNVSGLFKAPRIKLKPYKLTLDTEHPYKIKGFVISNKYLRMNISEGYVILGQTKEGPTEALIFSKDGTVSGDIYGTVFTNGLRKVMLRFNPGTFTNRVSAFLEKTEKNDKYNKFLKNYHKKVFKHFYHNNDKALLPPSREFLCEFITKNRLKVAVMELSKKTMAFILNNDVKRYWK